MEKREVDEEIHQTKDESLAWHIRGVAENMEDNKIAQP